MSETRAEPGMYTMLVDFDGTAAHDDVQQRILDTFADRDVWRRINREWVEGKLTTAQRAQLQWDLITASEQDILAFVDTLILDPAFTAFVTLCEQRNFPLVIVSDGFDFYIRPMLERAKLGHLAVVSNHLHYHNHKPHMRFLHQRAPDQYYGNDKTYVIEQMRQEGKTLVYIGDGDSDRDAAQHADLVFAKDRLALYCKKENLCFEPFQTFTEVVSYFE